MDIEIRRAVESDLPAIVDIYNQSIPGGWSTADTQAVSVNDRRQWFKRFSDSRPIWVAETTHEIVATAYLTSFYEGRPAYDATAEISVYVGSNWHRQGIGRSLKEFVIEQCPMLGITSLLSLHFDHNEATARINEQLGFEVAGHVRDIAQIDGQSHGLRISVLRIPAQ